MFCRDPPGSERYFWRSSGEGTVVLEIPGGVEEMSRDPSERERSFFSSDPPGRGGCFSRCSGEGRSFLDILPGGEDIISRDPSRRQRYF